MKKIIALLLVLFLAAACGTTGNVVKEQDNDANNIKVLPSISEKCELSGKSLSCVSIKATSDNTIRIKLKNDRYGIASLTKVTLLGLDSCSKKFSGEVEDGIDFRETTEFVLNCNMDKLYLNTPIRIEYNRYEPTLSNGPQFAPYTVWDEEVEGNIISIIY